MHAHWYFDFISPYAYLQLARFGDLPASLEVRPSPILFAGLLGHWGHKGPAEIPAKRVQTYRQCHWLAERMGVPYRTPPAHPFPPLPPLRLAWAAGPTVETVREIYRFIWGEGGDVTDPDAFGALAARLGVDDVAARLADPGVKERLRAATEAAARRGVFGVPTFDVGGELFWGLDATDMLLDYLEDPRMFERGELARVSRLPAAVHRRESALATPPSEPAGDSSGDT